MIPFNFTLPFFYAGQFCATRSTKNEADLTKHLLCTTRAMIDVINIVVHTQMMRGSFLCCLSNEFFSIGSCSGVKSDEY